MQTNLKSNKKIGVLDAGVGGLYALSKIRQRVPDAEITYIGDCKNLPYNIHSNDWIIDKTQAMISFLRKQEVNTLAIACHTISSLEGSLQTEGLAVYNIVTSTLRHIRQQKQLQHYLFIGTRTTIESGCYQPAWLKKGTSSYIKAIELATRIEHDGPNNPNTIIYIVDLIKKHFLKYPTISEPIKVVLACTHYILVKSHIVSAIKAKSSSDVSVIEPGVLLGDDFPLSSSLKKGVVNLYLNQDKNPSFQKRLDDILKFHGLCDVPVHFIQL